MRSGKAVAAVIVRTLTQQRDRKKWLVFLFTDGLADYVQLSKEHKSHWGNEMDLTRP